MNIYLFIYRCFADAFRTLHILQTQPKTTSSFDTLCLKIKRRMTTQSLPLLSAVQNVAHHVLRVPAIHNFNSRIRRNRHFVLHFQHHYKMFLWCIFRPTYKLMPFFYVLKRLRTACVDHIYCDITPAHEQWYHMYKTVGPARVPTTQNPPLVAINYIIYTQRRFYVGPRTPFARGGQERRLAHADIAQKNGGDGGHSAVANKTKYSPTTA